MYFGPAAPARHPAERRRDRPAHVAAAGRRTAVGDRSRRHRRTAFVRVTGRRDRVVSAVGFAQGVTVGIHREMPGRKILLNTESFVEHSATPTRRFHYRGVMTVSS